MARTNTTLVQGILLKDYDAVDSPDLDPFIATATVIIDRVNTCATSKGYTLTDAELELMERWLSAHCYCASDQPYSARSTSRASGTFQGQTGMRLEGTKYGQMALTLDPSGCLKSIVSNHHARGVWLGRPPSAQTPEEDF